MLLKILPHIVSWSGAFQVAVALNLVCEAHAEASVGLLTSELERFCVASQGIGVGHNSKILAQRVAIRQHCIVAHKMVAR